MKKLISSALMIVMVSALLVSCKKYEEDSGLMLSTVKSRLVQTWTADQYIDGTTGISTTASGESMTIVKDGTVTSSFTWGGATISLSGTWELSSDKSQIITSFTTESNGVSTTTKTTSDILKLDKESFWIKDSDGDKTYFKK